MTRPGLARWIAPLLLVGGPLLAQEPQAAPPGPDDAVRVERIELRSGTRMDDALRIMADVGGLNIVTTPEAGKVVLSGFVLQDVSMREVLDALCKAHELWYRRDGTIIRVMTTEEYSKDLTVVREPVTRVFSLLHPNPIAVASAIRDLFAPRVNLSFGVDQSDLGGIGGIGGGGFGGTGGLGGSGTGAFSNRVGGGFNNSFGGGFNGGFGGGFNGGFGGGFNGGYGGFNGGYGNGYGNGNVGGNGQRGQENPEIDSERVTADRLARLAEEGGVVKGDAQGLIDGRPIIAVTVNRRHNLIVVRTADADALREIERLVVELDRPLPEVLLEVKVLEVRLGDGFESALDVDWVDAQVDPTHLGIQTLTAMGSPAVGGGALVYQFLNEHVRARIRLLGRESRLATLATPLLLCANGETAQIFIGEERPLVRSFDVQTITTQGVVTSQVVPTVDLRDVGNTLRLVPRINADRTVSLTLIQDISSVNAGGANLPVINPNNGQLGTFAVDTVNTANLVGTVVAKDGLTIAVGGLIRKEKSDTQEGVPWLQEIPIIGWLFGSVVRNQEQRELVLLITPHVLSTPAEGEARTRARMRSLSLHPWHDMGERALQHYDRDDVPGSEGYRLLIEDYLLPIPDPEHD